MPPAALHFNCLDRPLRSAADDEIDRFRALALLVRLDIEADVLPFVQHLQPGLLDSGDVDEDVSRAIVRLDETVTTFPVEELYHSSLRHKLLLPRMCSSRQPPRKAA